jgi:hypothetical protein
MSKKTVPVHNLNVPNGGPQNPITIPSNAPVHSSYTGNLLGYGPQPTGVKCDAPRGHPNYGKDFHVIEYNPANNSWMEHGMFKRLPN